MTRGLFFTIAAVCGLLAAVGDARADCRWTQHNDSLEWKGDKRAHLYWSAAGGAAIVAADEVLSLKMSATTQVALAVLPGFLRELKTGCGQDVRGGFSHQDMVYNVIGAAAGVALGHGAMLILTPRSVTYRMEF